MTESVTWPGPCQLAPGQWIMCLTIWRPDPGGKRRPQNSQTMDVFVGVLARPLHANETKSNMIILCLIKKRYQFKTIDFPQLSLYDVWPCDPLHTVSIHYKLTQQIWVLAKFYLIYFWFGYFRVLWDATEIIGLQFNTHNFGNCDFRTYHCFKWLHIQYSFLRLFLDFWVLNPVTVSIISVVVVVVGP